MHSGIRWLWQATCITDSSLFAPKYRLCTQYLLLFNA